MFRCIWNLKSLQSSFYVARESNLFGWDSYTPHRGAGNWEEFQGTRELRGRQEKKSVHFAVSRFQIQVNKVKVE